MKQLGFTLIELMIVVAIIGILAAIAFPQYQTYVVKAQVTRAMTEAGALKTKVETCITDGKTTVGVTTADCNPEATGSSILFGLTQGAGIPPNTGVPRIDLTVPQTITATFGISAASAITNETLTWTRTAPSGAWACTTSAGIAPKYKPAGCQ